MRQILRMSFYEYDLRFKAWNLQRLDQEYFIAKQAWMNREIEAKNSKGTRYIYKSFKKFFDYEAHEKEILEGKPEEKAPANTVAGRYAEYMRKKHGHD